MKITYTITTYPNRTISSENGIRKKRPTSSNKAMNFAILT
jgi:hypothetical protein